MPQYHNLSIIAEAVQLIKMGGVPMKILAHKASVDRTTIYKWEENGATVGALVALLGAAGYELKIVRKKEVT